MTAAQSAQVKPTTCKCLINGEWQESTAKDHSFVFNPSSGEKIAAVPLGGAEDVDRAVVAAQAAFREWREVPVVERARYMFRFRSRLENRAEEIARSIAREQGKTLPEARASVQRGIEVVEFACGIPSLFMGESIENIATDVDCETVRHPLGVCAGITPFNFPAMVPLWMFPIAITCGNTFILKPSERVPLTSLIIAEALMETDLPKGVFNIVHGGKDCVNALIEHPQIKALSFVGSSPIAKYIYKEGTARGKRVQAAGGAKNHIVVMPDADLGPTVQALKASAFGCAGERCMAGSLAVTVGEAADQLMPALLNSTSKIKLGRTDGDDHPDMGPVISSEHLQRLHALIGQGEKDGAEVTLDGRKAEVSTSPHGYFLGPTILDKANAKMSVVKEELFGPVLSVVRVQTIAEAIQLGAECEFGNGAVLYTQSGAAARQFKRNFNAGMIGINVGVPAPMAWFSFTGWNNSFYGDLHIQGKEGIQFYTHQKMTMSRWFRTSASTFQDPIWKGSK